MNENIDLTKILKDCPKGTKLYSIAYGDVKFEKIAESKKYPIHVRKNDSCTAAFSADGQIYANSNGECALFPSKDQRDWSKFSAPWLEKQGEDAPSQPNERAWLYLVSDVLTWKDGIGQYLDDLRVQELAKILCSKYEQKLYNPSVLSYSSNTRKNGQKFDPNTLEPFDKVLARDDGEEWNCVFFSHIVKDEDTHPYACGYDMFTYCIPYNDDTKHLVGTNEDAPEFYRYWED